MNVRSLNPPHLPESDANAACAGDYAAGERGGEENPSLGQTANTGTLDPRSGN